MNGHKLDETEKKVLKALQRGIEPVERPFDAVAAEAGLESGAMAVEMAAALRDGGYVRRFGPIFDAARLGYVSALAAVAVGEENIERVAELINSYDEVTHNYLREGSRFNMWFTVTAASGGRLEEIISEIKAAAGMGDVLCLPAVKKYKVKVEFDI